MRISESQLRRVIRSVIREQHEQVIEEGPREIAIGAAMLAALAIFGLTGIQAPDNTSAAITQAAGLAENPDVAKKANEHGVDIELLQKQGNQGMGMGADLAGMGMAD